MQITVATRQVSPLLNSVVGRSPLRVSAQQIALAKAHGIVTPITVRGGDPDYELLAGLKTWHLARVAEIDELPAFLISDISEERARELAAIDQGRDQSPLADARLIDRLRRGGMPMKHAAATLGVERQVAYQLVSLLTLSEEVQHLVDGGELKISVARQLTKLDGRTQLGIARTVIRDDLSSRQASALIKARTGQGPAHAVVAAAEIVDPDLKNTLRRTQRLDRRTGQTDRQGRGGHGQCRLRQPGDTRRPARTPSLGWPCLLTRVRRFRDSRPTTPAISFVP